MRLTFIVLLSAMTVLGPVTTYAKKKQAAPPKKETVQQTPYEKLFKSKKGECVKGMFTVHKVDGKIYFEIPAKLFGRDMLLGSTVSEINDNSDALVGAKPTKPLHVRFMQQDSTILLQEFTARNTVIDPGYENIASAIKLNKIPATFATFPVKAYAPDSSRVIDVTSLFLTDIKDLRPFESGSSMGGLVNRTTSFKKELAYLDDVKAFEDNVSVKSVLTYTSDMKLLGILTLYKDKPTTAKMTRTFLLLPEEPMHPRVADSRIGIFFAGVEHFSNDDQVKALYYANRWNLEPSDVEAYKRGELVEPKKPIVFYVDSAFPEAWKPAIKQGIEEWNAAFEKIGFKNAVRALDFPTDDPEFDPDNLKYSCVRYAPTWTANAMGPSWKDPRSGEIVCASVYFHHNIAKLLNNWRFVQTAQIDTSVRGVTLPTEVMQDGIRYVTAHEVGHCLGLMHNMAASAAFPVDSLRSATFTQKYGTTPSIMDYARFNYVAQPGDKGVKLTPPRLGVYDLYAIKWLYTPLFVSPEQERDTLDKWISEKSGDPLYRYGKQQVYSRYDPSAVEEDLGDDPIKASAYGIANLKYIMAHMNEWLKDEDKDFQHRTELYDQIIMQYKRYINNVLMNVGGLYLYDRQEGDAQPEAYKSVPKAVQQASVKFLLEQLYDMDWLVNEELLKNLPPQKSKAREMQIGSSSLFKSLLTIKKKNGVILSASLSDDPYTLNDYLEDLYQAVWKKTMQGKSLEAVDMTYQNDFIISMVSAYDPAAKAGSLLFTDPEAALTEMPSMWDRTYAPTLDEVILYDLDPTGFVPRMEGAIRMAADLQGFETEGFGWQREVKSDEVYNTKALQFSYLQKVKSLLERQQNTGSEETRAHYKHLLYKVNRMLTANSTGSSK